MEHDAFTFLAEHMLTQYATFGLKEGQYVKFNDKIMNNEKIRSRPKGYIELLQAMEASGLPIRITGIKPVRASIGHDGSGATDTWLADIAAEMATGIPGMIATVPVEVLEMVKDSDQWPDIPEKWRYKAPEGNKVGPAPEMTMANDSHRQLNMLSPEQARSAAKK